METEDKFSDSFVERYKHCEFLHAKDNLYKVVELEFEKSDLPGYLLINVLQFDHKKLKLEDNIKVTYDEKPCWIYFKTVCTNVIKGHHLKRNTYLQIMSVGFSDMVWKILANLINLTNERNKRLNLFADLILLKINCNRKLSLNKMLYFDDLIIHFDKIYNIDYKEKRRLVGDAYAYSSKIMLPA